MHQLFFERAPEHLDDSVAETQICLRNEAAQNAVFHELIYGSVEVLDAGIDHQCRRTSS